MKFKSSIGDSVVSIFSYTALIFLTIITLYPLWSLLVLSLSPREEAIRNSLRLITLNPTFEAYLQVFESPQVWKSVFYSVTRVVAGSAISVFLTALTAYPLSKRDFPLNRTFTAIILFTMFFSGGLIPTYLWINQLGLTNTMWSLLLPGAVTAYNLVIVRNFLMTIPESIEESAKIDGASDLLIWWKFILPLSKPVLATILLWMAVFHWNAYFDALIYITDRSKYPLQVILRRVLLEDQQDMFMATQLRDTKPTAETGKAALIMISTIPIVAVYPFLQKYFVKGIMLGSVKG